MSGEQGEFTRYDVSSSFPSPIATRPVFSSNGSNKRGKKPANPLHSLDALHVIEHSTTACIPLPRNARCRWDGERGKCCTKISGIPNTIGSTGGRKGIHHRVRTSLPSSLLYFPNNGPLKSNFANISARQLCLLPFRSSPRGKGKEGAPPKSRTRRNFFGKRSLPRIVATWSSRRAPPPYVEICARIEKELEKWVLDIEGRTWLKNSMFYAGKIIVEIEIVVSNKATIFILYLKKIKKKKNFSFSDVWKFIKISR